MPNTVASLALLAFPIFMMVLFARAQLQTAIIWSLLLGLMFLPEPPAGFDLPLMPAITKHNIPIITVFLIILYRYGLRGPLLPESKLARFLVLLFLFSPVLTTLTNTDPIVNGIVFLPGMDIKNAAAVIVNQFFLILPFLLARQFLATGGDQYTLVKAFAIAGLIYSIPMLIEIRLSPQLHRWVYGFHQHEFLQTVRFGGWRPMVFLYHGLTVAFFMLTAVVSALTLWRSTEAKTATRWLAAFVYLCAILILAKSLGAILYATLLIPLLLLFGNRQLIRGALVLALLAMSYPLLKGAGVIPEREMLELAAQIDPDRAQSLQFRFDQESELLVRANERPLFGWGIYGRNQFFDPNSGQILSVTDGRWIILIGAFGWAGYLAEFGILVLPLLMLWRLSGRPQGEKIALTAAPLCLLLAFNVVELLPNATLTPMTWLIAGALLGHAERLGAVKATAAGASQKMRWQPVM